MPRSGTRMVANILNSSPRVQITSEFPSGISSRMIELARAMDDFFSRRQYKDEQRWSEVRIDMIHGIWNCNYLQPLGAVSADWVGNKTPSNELFFSDYESLFAAAPPLYVYCLRSPFKVLKSLKNMPWNKRSEEENWERWKRSFNCLGEIELVCEDRLVIVSFDDSVHGDVLSIGRTLYQKMGVEITPEFEARWENAEPAQPTRSVIGPDVVSDLSDTTVRLVERDPVYATAIDRFPFLAR